MFTVVSPKNQSVYSPNVVTVGLVPSGKLHICCEIGKILVLNCVFLLFYAELERAAESGLV